MPSTTARVVPYGGGKAPLSALMGENMRMNLLRFSALGSLMAAGLVLAACATAADPGYDALAQGNYAKARDLLAPEQAQSPHDPYLELDLGWAYQNLGRMDLAEPLYRGAMADGGAAVAVEVSNPGSQGKTVATIACENLRAGLNNPNAC